jgi:hypothetical protein
VNNKICYVEISNGATLPIKPFMVIGIARGHSPLSSVFATKAIDELLSLK